jgi:hypothetical protein
MVPRSVRIGDDLVTSGIIGVTSGWVSARISRAHWDADGCVAGLRADAACGSAVWNGTAVPSVRMPELLVRSALTSLRLASHLRFPRSSRGACKTCYEATFRQKQ